MWEITIEFQFEVITHPVATFPVFYPYKITHYYALDCKLTISRTFQFIVEILFDDVIYHDAKSTN